MKWTRPISLVLVTISLVLFFKFLIGLWGYTVDDAFIVFRYAENLVDGNGLVWNVSSLRSEGYTSFSWLMLIVIGQFFGLNLLIYSKLLGLLFLLGTLYFFWKFSKELFKADLQIFVFSVALFFMLSNSFTALHTVAGLETIAFSFSLVALLWYAYKNDIKILSYVALFSSLTRPEGIIASFTTFSLIFIKSKHRKKHLKIVSLNFLFPLLLYFVIKFIYFGHLFSLPIFVKILNYSFDSIKPIIFLRFLFYVLPFLLLIYLNKTFQKSKLRLLLLGPLSYLIFYPFSNHWMNYGMRLYFPAYALIYLLTAISVGYFLKKNQKYLRIVMLLVVLVLFLNFNSITTFMAYSNFMPHYPETALYKIGMALGDFSNSDFLLVTSYAGAIPYFSKVNHVDTYGLTDPNIAINGVASFDYIDSIKPDLILVYNSVDKVPEQNVHPLPYEWPFILYAQEHNYTALPGILFIKDYYFIPLINPELKNVDILKTSLFDVSVWSKTN
ncbi:MAG: hypothetical protein GOU98_01310 [Candidatus Altiarchaeota archaeon]|nr:hypothetical protein [Candidatus Altiarchaeota archaeon]